MGVELQRRRRESGSWRAIARVLLAALDADRSAEGAEGLFEVLARDGDDRHGLLLDALAGGAALAEAAERHGVPGFVRLFLLSAGAQDVAELGSVVAALDQARLAGLHVHLRVIADLAPIAARLEAAGIPWAVLKGPALAEVVYPRPDLRSYGDLDLLVAPEAFGDALEALEALGGHVLDRNWRLAAEMARGEISLAMPSGTQVDLHWHPINDAAIRHRLGLSPGELLGRAQYAELRGVTTRLLNPLDSLIYVAVHGCLSGGFRLVWLEDVHRSVVSSSPSWEEVCVSAEVSGAGLLVGLMLDRTRRFRHTPVPAEVLGTLMNGLAGHTVLAVASALATPPRLVRGRHTGRSICEAARETPGATARALIRAEATQWADDLRIRRAQPPTLEELRADSGSPHDRKLFLDRVARQRSS